MKICHFDDGVCVFCGAVRLNDRQICGNERTSFATKLQNFSVAAVSHLAAGMPMASHEEIIRRHDICLGCEHLKDSACKLCGCPISREFGYLSKLSWADQKCPAGKW